MSKKEAKGTVKEYPNRLYHAIPPWVEDRSVFHIRLRAEKDSLVEPAERAHGILVSVEQYSNMHKWMHKLAVLMPDHLHALLVFRKDIGMSETVRGWKRFLARKYGITWQDGFFDHRIRNESEYVEKAGYIRMNPVRAGLVHEPEEWPWALVPMEGVDAVVPNRVSAKKGGALGTTRAT